VRRRTMPSLSRLRNRCVSTFALMAGRPVRKSVKRLGPSTSSRTIGSVQRWPSSPTESPAPHPFRRPDGSLHGSEEVRRSEFTMDCDSRFEPSERE
jgi:hypothetical protein